MEIEFKYVAGAIILIIFLIYMVYCLIKENDKLCKEIKNTTKNHSGTEHSDKDNSGSDHNDKTINSSAIKSLKSINRIGKKGISDYAKSNNLEEIPNFLD